jgi:hypothetical protein
LVRLLVLATAGSLLTGCAVTRVDAPLAFGADRRLEIMSPDQDDDVGLPVAVEWRVKDFELAGGNHFGVFVDRVPISPGQQLRLRVCTKDEQQPVQAGEMRRACHDDRDTIKLTDQTSASFDCFRPRDSAPKRERNTHTATVVLLDATNRRVGQAADSVRFRVDEADARACRGLGGIG